MGQKMPTEFMPGLFDYKVPVDGSSSSSARKKQKAWDDPSKHNPMVRAYGQHDDPDLRCKDCNYLMWKQYAHKYFKCALRGNSGGPATDHRKFWPACRKFEPYNENQNHRFI